MEKTKKKKKNKKKINLKAYGTLIIVVVVVVGLFVLFVLPQLTKGHKQQVVLAQTTLEKVIKTNRLSTYQIEYEGVAVLYNEKKPEKEDCYVKYKATVKAGIDFDRVELKFDQENNQLIIALPYVTLSEPNLDNNSIEYMYLNNKMNQNGLLPKAREACLADVKEECKNQKAIYTLALDNAKVVITALVTPFLDDFGDNVTIVFESLGE